MKSNIQARKEELRSYYRQNKDLPTIDNCFDYIGYELKEKDEEGNNYFVHIDSRSTEEEIKEFLAVPVHEILSIKEWYAGTDGGVEFATDRYGYCVETWYR